MCEATWTREWMSSSVESRASAPQSQANNDPLDRLAAHFARAMRSRIDAEPMAPIAIADLFHTLLPPRATASAVGLADEPGAYDVVLMRLLSGERGYVLGDADLQRALAAELERPEPDPTAYRSLARAQVGLAPRALDLLDEGSGCRCCGGRLPRTRAFRYCPTCGEDLGVKRCPACSTECSVEWHFCVTCGRALETSD